MYKAVILTDDNFDDEVESLCEDFGLEMNTYSGFVDELDNGFTRQKNDGKEEWIRARVMPNKGSDFRQAFQEGQLAYEFENGFVIFDFEVLL